MSRNGSESMFGRATPKKTERYPKIWTQQCIWYCSVPQPQMCKFLREKKNMKRFNHRSKGMKRDKLNGTNGAEFADFRRFCLICADFRFSWKLQHFGGADFRRKPQETADCRRKPQNFTETRLSHLICPF